MKKSLAKTKQSRGKYIKFSVEDRFTIGRYAAVHGPLAAVRKFKDQYPNLNEISVRTFRDKYNKKLKASGNSRSPAKKIIKKAWTTFYVRSLGRSSTMRLCLHKIPHSMVINIDQTPSKYAPVSSRTLAAQNSKHVSICGSSDKTAITATFGITHNNSFLPMQLIYGGKAAQSLPKFEFPSSFSLSVNPTHFSNTKESISLIEDVIIPNVVSQRKSLGVGED